MGVAANHNANNDAADTPNNNNNAVEEPRPAAVAPFDFNEIALSVERIEKPKSNYRYLSIH